VTKAFRSNGVLVHAWGREKMNEYVKRIAEIAALGAIPIPQSLLAHAAFHFRWPAMDVEAAQALN